MIDPTPANLCAEIEAAEKFRDSFLHDYDARIDRRTGTGYREGRGEHAPENHAHEYESLVVPKIIFNDPRVRGGSRSGDDAEAMELEVALNQWSRDTKLRRPLTAIAVDFGMTWGAMHVTRQPRPGQHPRNIHGPHWPVAQRLSNRRFFLDPLCLMVGEARHMGHMYVTTKDDLLREAEIDPEGWDVAAIKALQQDDSFRTDAKNRYGVPDRGEVCVYEMWIPSHELPGSMGPDEGFHGTIFTLVKGQGESAYRDTFIRAPRAFYGPRDGPYELFGAYIVPDSPYPLSPLAAVEAQAQDLNAHAKAANASAAQYKKLVLVSETNSKLAKALADKPHNFVVKVPGLKKDEVIEVEIGGVPAEMVKMLELTKMRLDRTLGMDDAQRGTADPDATATAVAVADSASTTRLAFLRQQYADGVQGVFRKAGWYFHNDSQAAIPLGAEAKSLLGVPPQARATFVGGGFSSRFDDLDIDLEVHSMGFTGNAELQRQMAAVNELVIQTAPLIPTTPWIDWVELFRQNGDALNKPGLAKLARPELALGLMGMGALATPGPVGDLDERTDAAGRAREGGGMGAGAAPGNMGGLRPMGANSAGAGYAQEVA